MTYYKVLDKEGHSCFGGDSIWSLPTRSGNGEWVHGEWMEEIKGSLVPCYNGYHLVTIEHITRWLGDRIFEAEFLGEVVEADEKVVVRKCRLIRECTGWSEKVAREFACECAERVLPLYEEQFPEDDSARNAIDTARKYANGEATLKDLSDARRAVREALSLAENNVSWEALKTIEQVTLESASEAASYAATWAVVAVESYDSERQWQIDRLLQILEMGDE